MKKSTATILLGITGLLTTLTAANLKLSSHYKQGKIGSYYTAQMLSVFHNIKEIGLDEGDFDYYKTITIRQQKDSSAVLYEYYSSPNLIFKVENDTLFIIPDSKEKKRKNERYLTILCPELKSLSSLRSSFTLNKMKTDSLLLIADRQSQISFTNGQINTLSVMADSLGNVSITSSDTIPHATIQLKGFSSFSAQDVIILNRKLQLSPGSSLSLSGKSVENFGIKRN